MSPRRALKTYPYKYSKMTLAASKSSTSIDSSDSDWSADSPNDTESIGSVRSFNELLPYNEKTMETRSCSARVWRRRCLGRRVILGIVGIMVCTATVIFIFLTLTFTVPHRHTPKSPSTGISSVVENWRNPEDSMKALSPWPPNFTRGVRPMTCHSHNDYWQDVPLFKALAAGCTGIEADVWINDKETNGNLLVGHSHISLSADRTLQNLYIKPLIMMLEEQNRGRNTNDTAVGIFESSPNTTVTLFLDFKQEGKKMWPYVNQQLEALRSGNWLSHWDESSKQIMWRPLIVVASGDAPFDLISSADSNTHRDIFYDAPLDDISNPKYSTSNSYYASVSMTRTLGLLWGWKLSSKQLEKMKSQIDAANAKGLIPRYWGAPTWPWKLNEYIWGVEVENGIGLLNIDRFTSDVFYPLVTRFGENRLSW